MNTILLIHSDRALAALPWAARIAAATRSELLLLCVSVDPVSTLDAVVPDGAESCSELVRTARAALAETGVAEARVYDCRGPKPHRVTLNALAELGAGQVILHELFDMQSPIKANLVRRMARAAPYDILLLDASDTDCSPRRVLFTQAGGRGEFGLEYAARTFAGDECPILLIPDPERAARSARYFRKVLERLPSEAATHLRQLSPAESIRQALCETVEAGDLVLFDADNADRVSRLLAHVKSLRQDRQDIGYAVGITRAADAAGPGKLERVLERFRQHVPKLDRTARRDLFAQLDRGGRLSTDFMVMLMVSAAIAALGLIQNSPAVVIGAMLVAPLMTPLLATAMALVQGNIVLFRTSLSAMLMGVGAALLCAMLIGLLSPWSDLSSQIVERGSPNVFDLGIAFLSGIAAAYALARPGLAGTLVGVAVAVALVPPLASTGIAAVKLEFAIAFGAAILFATNLIAIILGAAMVFLLFGLDISLRGNQAPRWVRLSILALAVALLPTVGVLWQNLQTQIQEGVHRPYARPLPWDLRHQIEQRVEQQPGASIVFMGHSDIEHGFGVEIVVAVPAGVDPSMLTDIEALVKAEMGETARVRIIQVQAITPN